MKKRGAYFFVLDALIGGAIFLISVVMIMGSYMNAPQTKQTYTLAEDLMDLLLKTKVIEFRDSEGVVAFLSDNGYITNPQQSLFQQIAELHYTNNDELAFNLTKVIVDSLLEDQYGMNYTIRETKTGINTTIYNRSAETLESAQFTLTSRKITFFSLDETTFFGPDITEFKIWS
ncbi:hypothetical protein HQ533_05550 [Candidatus Woesearchaeota archaeon]|nr:hypothetical protein [Candidatus Woesearchaeota archaeon]